jgi:phenylalanyl-tRNA synthetase beta chain
LWKSNIQNWVTQNSKIEEIVNGVPNQDYYVAGIMLNKTYEHVIKTANSLFEALKIDYNIQNTDESCNLNFFHPTRTAKYTSLDNTYFGFAGEMHPNTKKQIGLKNNVQIFEFNLNALLKYKKHVKELPIYTSPVAKTDFAFVVKNSLPANELVKLIKVQDLVESVKIFDVYADNTLNKQNKKSIAISVNFRADNKTLSTGELTILREQIIRNVETKFSAKLRDF